MESHEAARNLEVIRTLMERTCQYQLLTAKAGLVAGSLAIVGAASFFWIDANNAAAFASVWTLVFCGALTASVIGTVLRGRERGEPVWSRQARAVVIALTPSLFAGLLLSAWFFAHGLHAWLPGIWMLCYGQGALATATYAPVPIRRLGLAVLAAAGPTLWIGPQWSAPAMAIVFGLGHLALGGFLLRSERLANYPRLHREVA